MATTATARKDIDDEEKRRREKRIVEETMNRYTRYIED